MSGNDCTSTTMSHMPSGHFSTQSQLEEVCLSACLCVQWIPKRSGRSTAYLEVGQVTPWQSQSVPSKSSQLFSALIYNYWWSNIHFLLPFNSSFPNNSHMNASYIFLSPALRQQLHYSSVLLDHHCSPCSLCPLCINNSQHNNHEASKSSTANHTKAKMY